MTKNWPADWNDLIQGIGCEMCDSARPESDAYGVRIFRSPNVDAVLQRANIQRGYTLVIWRGRHITEPYELSGEESSEYWRSVMQVAKALTRYYQPLKMNYETLGNTVPHLHTHLVPRYVVDPAPGRPFPLLPQDGSEPQIPDDELLTQARALRTELLPNLAI
ncbi:HIT family protein [Nocardia sp. NPDC006044]|uniref:HIT family protein n=1 Tax=Nocardia sp. NPDC006044 TaxID=3364306 RepID=UPI003685BAD1